MAKTRLGKGYTLMLQALERRRQLERQLWVVGAFQPRAWEPSKYLMLLSLLLEVQA